MRWLWRPIHSDIALFVLVVGFSLAYLSLFIFQSPYDIADEGYLYYVVQRLAAGDKPYLDIELHSYLPPMFGAFAAYASVAGESIAGFRALMAIGLSLATGLAYLGLSRVLPRRWAVLLAIAIALVPGPFYKFYVRLLQLAVLTAALWWWRSRSRAAWASFAATSAAGLVFRVDAFYAGIALCALLLGAALLRKELTRAAAGRRLAEFGAAALVAIVIVRVYVGDSAVFAVYLRRLVGVMAIAAERTGSVHRLQLPSLATLFVRDADTGNAWMAYGSIATLVVLALAFGLAVRRDRFGAGTVALALVLAWAGLNAPQYLWVRPDVYHATQQAFAFLVAAGLALHQLAIDRRNFAMGLAGVALTMLLVGVAVLHAQALRWSAGVLRLDLAYSNPCGVPYVSYAGDGTTDLLEVACAYSQPDDTLEAIPFATGVNHLSAHRRPSRYLFVLADDFSATPAQQEYVDEVSRHPPSFVVYERDSTMSRDSAGLLRNYAPLIDRYYSDGYLPLLSQQGYTLLLRAPDPGARTPQREARALARAEVAFSRRDTLGGLGAAIVALRSAPEDLVPVILLARQASQRKDVEVAAALWLEAFNRCKRAIRRDSTLLGELAPQLAESAVAVGQLYLDQARYAAAESVFRELAELNPSSAQAELILGQVLRRSKGCAAARPRLIQALALDPTLEAARAELTACP